MSALDERYLDALRTLSTTLDDDVEWAVTGSTGFALQGVPLSPDDVDVQTTGDVVYEIAERFAEQVVDPVSFSESTAIRSHFGALELDGVRVELMGGVQKRRADGTWEPPVDVTEHRVFVDAGGVRVPVLSLRYEAEAYERLGRSERAALLSEHVE
ncbi:nucleotidyltransferase domain-containing protein [Halomicrococcus sp. NG-SE-24]|uniref:nucleotidyltransferase domain-containing protein n=1 Tax=Halomicrococcus sp. NG-SE-24 TaxID=3436928 RepID=UPI003D99A6B4